MQFYIFFCTFFLSIFMLHLQRYNIASTDMIEKILYRISHEDKRKKKKKGYV